MKNIQTGFVVLFHQHAAEHPRADHWDLMLEQNGKLLTWALEQPPAPGKLIPSTRLDDHRLAYLDYEGPISGQRGTVSRVLRGSYRWKQSFEEQVAVLELPDERWEVVFRNEIGRSETGSEKFLIEVSLV